MYRIVLKKSAKKFIEGLPRNEKVRIVAAIEQLPDGEDIKQLKGHPGMLRLRVGPYRIIYTVDHGELVVCVIDAGPRGQIQGHIAITGQGDLSRYFVSTSNSMISRPWRMA